MTIYRSRIFHTPGGRLVYLADGGLAVEQGRVAASGSYAAVRALYPEAAEKDFRAGLILPGFIDTHIHFPQVRIVGGLGHSLLDWLEQLTLPEEARLADAAYARRIAREFVGHLAAHGTTTALVFGSHFVEATAALFEEAGRAGLKVFAGLVLADRMLRAELHQRPEDAYRDSAALMARFPGRYVVTPRFALSASEAMLEVCGALMKANPGVRFTSHLNENPREVAEVARLFPWAGDYLAVYERFGLTGRRSVFAHDVYGSEAELGRLRESGTSVAHCPCSNAALGSGIFTMRRHVEAGVRFALGTDVGGGIGFGVMKEALQAYLMQRVAVEPMVLSSEKMLYLATLAGAEALDLQDETGDFTIGKAADFVFLEAAPGSVLEGVLAFNEDPPKMLGAMFTLAGSECIREVRVGGELVFSR